MGHIYWEKPEIKIPNDAYLNKSDARIFLKIMRYLLPF